MLSLLLPCLALAADPGLAQSAAPAQAQQGHPPPRDGNGRKPPPKRKGPPPKAEPHWESEPYVKPEAGAQLNTNSGGTSAFVTLGASAGIRYWQVGGPQPRWSGQTRARGLYGTGSGISMVDLRVGSFIGPRWGDLGLSFGPDLFWNTLQVSGSQDLNPSAGVEFPVMASYTVSKHLNLTGGVAPAWLADPARSVDWDKVDVPGFGDEFSYMGSANLNLQPLRLSVSYLYKVVATGVQQNLGFGVGLSM